MFQNTSIISNKISSTVNAVSHATCAMELRHIPIGECHIITEHMPDFARCQLCIDMETGICSPSMVKDNSHFTTLDLSIVYACTENSIFYTLLIMHKNIKYQHADKLIKVSDYTYTGYLTSISYTQSQAILILTLILPLKLNLTLILTLIIKCLYNTKTPLFDK